MKNIFILFFLISLASYAGVFDEINLFTREEKYLLNKKIDNLFLKKNIKVDIITMHNFIELSPKFTEGSKRHIVIVLRKNNTINSVAKIQFSPDLFLNDNSFMKFNNAFKDFTRLIQFSDIDFFTLQILNLIEQTDFTKKNKQLLGLEIRFIVFTGFSIILLMLLLFNLFKKKKMRLNVL